MGYGLYRELQTFRTAEPLDFLDDVEHAWRMRLTPHRIDYRLDALLRLGKSTAAVARKPDAAASRALTGRASWKRLCQR